jgi:hypothetical protein
MEGEGTNKAAVAGDAEHAQESKKGRICRVSWACGSATSHKSVYISNTLATHCNTFATHSQHIGNHKSV